MIRLNYDKNLSDNLSFTLNKVNKLAHFFFFVKLWNFSNYVFFNFPTNHNKWYYKHMSFKFTLINNKDHQNMLIILLLS